MRPFTSAFGEALLCISRGVSVVRLGEGNDNLYLISLLSARLNRAAHFRACVLSARFAFAAVKAKVNPCMSLSPTHVRGKATPTGIASFFCARTRRRAGHLPNNCIASYSAWTATSQKNIFCLTGADVSLAAPW